MIWGVVKVQLPYLPDIPTIRISFFSALERLEYPRRAMSPVLHGPIVSFAGNAGGGSGSVITLPLGALEYIDGYFVAAVPGTMALYSPTSIRERGGVPWRYLMPKA